jgi:hypothetical protein
VIPHKCEIEFTSPWPWPKIQHFIFVNFEKQIISTTTKGYHQISIAAHLLLSEEEEEEDKKIHFCFFNLFPTP